jgi:hypothetical protein
MKLTINTPEAGDWTVIQDENGKIVYEGHRAWDDLTSAVLEYANPLCDLKFIECPDDVFEETF